jgi:WD40 repeat protein
MSGFTEAPADAGTDGGVSPPVLLRRLEGQFYGRMATASFVQSTGEPPRPLLLAASVPGLHYIEVWHTGTGEKVKDLEGQGSIVANAHAAYELPDHRSRIYGGCTNGQFIIVDGDSLTKVHEGDLGGRGVRSCYVYKTLEGDRPRIISGHSDGSVTVLDGETGELIRRLDPPNEGANPPVVAVKGFDHPSLLEHRTVAASGGLVRVFCPEGGGEVMMTLEMPHPPINRLACFEPSHAPGRFCVAACTNWAAWVWEEGALIHTFEASDEKEKILDMTVSEPMILTR